MYCFLAVDKAYKLLLDPEQKKRALDVIHAGKEYVEHMVSVHHLLSIFKALQALCIYIKSAIVICIWLIIHFLPLCALHR